MRPDDHDPGVPLSHYRDHPGTGVLVTCIGCQRHEVLDLEATIKRLKVRGYGDESTGIRAVGGFIRRACPQCGGTRYETRPHWVSGPKAPGWGV